MKELLELIRGMEMSGVVVVVNFIMRRVQPCKERAHPTFDFKGDTDGTRERTERLTKEAVLHRAAELFAPNVSYTMLGQPRPFNCTNSPPQVKISTVVPDAFYPMLELSSGLICLWKDPLAERAVYFSGVPRSDWLEAVDTRPTTQPEEGAVRTSSESECEGAGQKESPPGIRESSGEKGGGKGIGPKEEENGDIRVVGQ